ncbi:type II secretion system protein [Filifactor villosus]|uniref:Type II secretion system protein n=2 Tax=Filifactor villosus TaxID=29374 RepID=A0ABV9QJJ6_9FIRM
MKKIQKKRKGFTLAELVVVVTILGILMVIAVMRFSSVSDSANMRAFEANHKLAVSAIQMYMADNNGKTPPDDTTAFEAYIASSTDATKGLAALQGKPKGATDATYKWNKDTKTLTSTYKSNKAGAQLVTLTYTP